MAEQGLKFDGGKLRYDLLPVHALEEVTRVITLGAEKYDPENWKRVPEGRRRYTAAAFRHIEAWRKGEVTDEIGTHHIANAISNLMFILEKELQGLGDVTSEAHQSPWYPDNSGEWIEYNGGGQPVEGDVVVEVLLDDERDYQCWKSLAEKANEWCWGNIAGSAKIVAYKVVK